MDTYVCIRKWNRVIISLVQTRRQVIDFSFVGWHFFIIISLCIVIFHLVITDVFIVGFYSIFFLISKQVSHSFELCHIMLIWRWVKLESFTYLFVCKASSKVLHDWGRSQLVAAGSNTQHPPSPTLREYWSRWLWSYHVALGTQLITQIYVKNTET